MTRRITGPRSRRAFTLIELLVVISIIAILMGLTTAAVQRVRIAGKRATVSNEIGQMGSSLANLQRDRGNTPIPSVIVLREKMNYDSNNAVEVASANFLKQFWPQIPLTVSPGGSTPAFPPGNMVGATPPQGINWNGDNTISNVAWTLEGDQCLVFFLGGIPNPTGGTSGFGKNPRDPSDASGFAPVLFEFPANRLVKSSNPAGAAGFYSFVDPFGTQPYAYFSSYGRKNGYYPYAGAPINFRDCQTLTGVGFSPYQDTATSAFQPTGFQIVCAGADKDFGVGGLIQTGGVQGSPTSDNITNFFAGQLSGY